MIRFRRRRDIRDASTQELAHALLEALYREVRYVDGKTTTVLVGLGARPW